MTEQYIHYRNADFEAKERSALLGKYKNLEHEIDGLKENLDEELAAKENLIRLCNKAQNESDAMRQKYEIEGVAKAEELEMSKLKLQVCIKQFYGWKLEKFFFISKKMLFLTQLLIMILKFEISFKFFYV